MGAQSTSGSVSVADLNIVVADALNYGTSGPTAAAVTNIRDSINTINAQAAQRYIARISLDANVPGNGMGGSAQRNKVADPAASTVANTANAANGKIPTACGAGVYYEQRAENGNPAAASNLPVPANIPGAGNTVGSGQNKAQAPATNYAVSGPAVNAQCGTTANATGTVASNTALVRTVMNPVTMTAGTAGAPPYKLVGAALGTAGTAAAGTTNSESAVTAATRGQNTNSGADYMGIAPIGCIDASVAFLETKIYSTMVAVTVGGVTTAQTAGRHMVIKPCDPEGYAGVSKNTNTLAQNLGLYHVGGGITGTAACTATGAAASYCNSVFANGGNKPAAVAAAAPNPATSAISALQAASINRVWDPILAAQLTQGAMCCAAQYYGTAGVARPAINKGGTADGMPVSGFVPPLSGGDMAAEVSPGGMCPAHSKGTTGSGTVGNAAQTNPAMVELLEDQAFYAALAPSQYSLPTTSSTATTQTARAAKQKQCATHITSMMKLNKATAVTAEAGKFGHSYSAINFPLWKVGIGAGNTPNQYTVPNGYCYANARFDDFAKVGTQSTFKGAEKLGQLVSGPNMAIVADNEACGRANTACAPAAATWNGGPAVMATCYGDACTTGGILNTTGAIPVA